MFTGKRIRLRPVNNEDWLLFDEWSQKREALWGSFQRFQPDEVPSLRQAYIQTGLFLKDLGILMVERLEDRKVIGLVKYIFTKFTDTDFSHPEIGYILTETSARKQGLAQEAVLLLLNYLFSRYPIQRVSAFTDTENLPSQKLLSSLGFEKEGVVRQALYRDGNWFDAALYGLLHKEWALSKRGDSGRISSS